MNVREGDNHGVPDAHTTSERVQVLAQTEVEDRPLRHPTQLLSCIIKSISSCGVPGHGLSGRARTQDSSAGGYPSVYRNSIRSTNCPLRIRTSLTPHSAVLESCVWLDEDAVEDGGVSMV